MVATTNAYGLAVLHKDGMMGWQKVYEQPDGGGAAHLRGFLDGDLLLYGVSCGIATIHGSTSHCESGFGGGIADLFVVSNELAYAVERDRARGWLARR